MLKFIKVAVLVAVAAVLVAGPKGAEAGVNNGKGAQRIEIGGCGRVVVVLPNGDYVELPEAVDPANVDRSLSN